MPLSPFIGLSTIIHISIIFGHKLFNPKNKERKKRKVGKITVLNSIASTCIIMIIFTLVSVQAGVLVHSSIVDRHSSVKLLNNVIAQIRESNISSPPLVKLPKYVSLN